MFSNETGEIKYVNDLREYIIPIIPRHIKIKSYFRNIKLAASKSCSRFGTFNKITQDVSIATAHIFLNFSVALFAFMPF